MESGKWKKGRKKKNAFFSGLCVCAVVSTGCVVHIAGDDCVLWWARKRVPNFPHYTIAAYSIVHAYIPWGPGERERERESEIRNLI